MQTWIYDIEVFKADWCIVAKTPDKKHVKVIINDNQAVREFFSGNRIFGGFNNKHYDDWLVSGMIAGADPTRIKEHNDWIIAQGKDPWEFSTVKGLGRQFKSFDLRDDIADKALSLKAIEGNLGLPIVESSIPFDIDRKLTDEEMDEVIRYCKHDVDATIELYKCRKDYIESKKLIGKLYDIPETTALGSTNGKLAQAALKAAHKTRDDERDYVIPEGIDKESIPESVMKFFMQIRDKSIPDDELFEQRLDVLINGCPVTYAWGGVHGAAVTIGDDGKAQSGFHFKADDNRLIVNYDVSSLYPSSMINFGFCSRGMENPDAFKQIVETRLEAKHNGDKAKADALKLIINSVYGCMLNPYNGLEDRKAGRSVCISNQLAMTDLTVNLARQCSTFEIVNFNTDGIMFLISPEEDSTAAAIVDDWCKRTRFEMERDDFAEIWQKDVNNYIAIMTNGKVKHKGGYVSGADGGDFKTNSLTYVQKAVVEYFCNDTPPEQTLGAVDALTDFQMILKASHKYEGVIQSNYYGDVPLQMVNRVYATKDKSKGALYKLKKKKITPKWFNPSRDSYKTQRGYDNAVKREQTNLEKLNFKQREELEMNGHYFDMVRERIAGCPEHAIVDNENKLKIQDIDLDFYVKLAYDRIKDYQTGKPVKIESMERIDIMATTTKQKNIYQKLMDSRIEFMAADVKKSGVNNYAEYKYFTLDDIVPVKLTIFATLGICDTVTFVEDMAHLTLTNIENMEESITFSCPIADDESMIKNPVQKAGAVQTYFRRYLYILALDIIEPDEIEAVTDRVKQTGGVKVPAPKRRKAPATVEERAEVKKELTDTNGAMSASQEKAIKNGLKKLRQKDAEAFEGYVTECVKKMKAGMTKADAENMLVEIGKKVA